MGILVGLVAALGLAMVYLLGHLQGKVAGGREALRDAGVTHEDIETYRRAMDLLDRLVRDTDNGGAHASNILSSDSRQTAVDLLNRHRKEKT